MSLPGYPGDTIVGALLKLNSMAEKSVRDHSERLGLLETFDLNEKLGHLRDLNDTHDLKVTSQ